MLTPAAAQAETYQWGSVAMGGGGFVSGIITSPNQQNLIYARTDVGGAYRWNEATQGWVSLLDWLPPAQTGFNGVESLAIDPSAPNRVYMMVGTSYWNSGTSAVLRSSDSGATFAVTDTTAQFKINGNGMGRQSGERLAVDPNNGNILFAGTRRNGLFKSTNMGASFSAVSALGVTTTANDNGISFILFDKRSSSAGSATKTIYAGVSRMVSTNLYVSKDAGASWAGVAGAITNLIPQHAALASDGSLFVTYANGAGPQGTTAEPMNAGAIRKYNTGTGAWTDITPALPNSLKPAYSGISVDKNNPSKLVASTINLYNQQPWNWGDKILVSYNGGTNWTDLFGSNKIALSTNGFPWIQGESIHWAGSVEFDPYNSERVFITSGNGIFSTTDLSASVSTWRFTVKGIEETVPFDVVSLPGGPLVSAIFDYDGFVNSSITSASSSGRHTPSMGNNTGLTSAPLVPSKLARSGSALYLSTNSGSSWTLANKPAAAANGKLAYSADGAVLLWAADNGTTYRTADNGASWTTAFGLPAGTAPVADMVNPAKFYAYLPSTGQFYHSLNGGISFELGTSPGSWGAQLIRTVPGKEGHVWVAMQGGGLKYSTDGGSWFNTVTTVGNSGAVGFGKGVTGGTYPAVFIRGVANGAAEGVYRSDNMGASWVRVNDDQHRYGDLANGQFVKGDPNVYGRFYMSTAGRGVAYGNMTAP
ncbi:MAG: exo-alpha-sialidase [Massilia sp.]